MHLNMETFDMEIYWKYDFEEASKALIDELNALIGWLHSIIM